MLEGYKPIDFSSVFPPMDLGQMRNRVGLSQAAQGILANSEFSQTPISSLLSAGLNSKGEAPKRKQTLWGRFTDLLSTPIYAIANATDDAIAGHQSSDTDSVLSDIGQVVGGVVTGAGRGIGTGLRGAFAGSETAADPMDKIYLGDALIRFDTHMSAEDAMNLDNLEEVRARLKNKKINQFSDAEEDKYFYNFDTGTVDVTDEGIRDYFEDMHLYGLGASMVADPLNFASIPTKAFSGAKGTSEIPEIIDGSKSIFDTPKAPLANDVPLNTTMPEAPNLGSMATGRSPGSYKVELNPAQLSQIPNPATGSLTKAPEWFNFPSSAADMGEISRSLKEVKTPVATNTTDPLDSLINSWAPGEAIKATRAAKGSAISVPKPESPKQLKIVESLSRPGEVEKLTADLIRRAGNGGADWATNVLGRLSTKYPGAPFDQTTKLVKHLSTIPDIARRLGSTSQRNAMIAAFGRTINSDIDAMRIVPKAKSAEVLLNEASASPVFMERLVAGAKGAAPVASKNPTRDAGIIDEVVKQFEPQLSLKSIPSGINDPAKYREAMRKHGAFTGPKQVNVWNSLTSKHLVNVKSPSRFSKALSILRQAEERFISMGHVPMSSTPKAGGSVPLRLSQVLDAIGPAAAAMSPTLLTRILRGEPEAIAKLPEEVVQKIEELKAGEAIVDGNKAIQGIDAGTKSIEDLIKGPLSAARMEEIVTIGTKVAEDITRSAGGSSVAGKTAAAATKASFIPKTAIDDAIRSNNLNTTAMISHPDVSTRLLKKYSSAPAVAKAINVAIGGPTLRQLGKLPGPAARTLDWIGARFNTAYKNADMRTSYLRNAATAKATVAKRAEYLNKLAKSYNVNDLELWNDALKAAQGRQAALEGSQAEALSREIKTVMENLFGSSGLKSSIAIENSVAGRSQLFMQELNSNLKKFGLGQYQFSKGGKAAKGEAKSPYADGTNWLNSWESWEITRPMEFLFKVQNVVEHTVREKIMFDEIVGRFGSAIKGGEFTHTVKGHPRLAGYYFGKEAASQAEQFVKNLKLINQPSSKAMQNFDKVLSKWKAGVTIYIPSHHIRNMIGDVYFNWVAGVNSARPYSTALKVMQSQKGRYEGLAELDKLTSPNALKRAIETGKVPGGNAIGKQTALTMKNGTNVTNDMVYISAFQQGILPTTRVLEDIPDDVATVMDKIKPLGGKGQKAAHSLSEGRDHYVRLAHYIDELKKSNKPFEQAVEDAASTIRKWHPDGMDLTKFERNVMRRMFPFYSWTRKAIPLIVESTLATPGKVMAIPKAQYLLQNALGIQTGPMSDPFPYDQLFPDWIREKGIGPVMGERGSYTVVNPGNPTMDIISQMNHPGKMAMGMLNPAARIPMELATGAEAQSGAPIDGITDTDYLAKQIPGVSHAGRITGEFGTSDTTKELSEGYNMQNILNLLTALGIQNTGPYQKSAEFDLREYLRSQK